MAFPVQNIEHKESWRDEYPKWICEFANAQCGCIYIGVDLNAIINKDYTSGYPIHISVYPDHLSVWNYGQLPEGWTEGRLFVKHPSMPYNPSLANVFFRSGDIESWGRGCRRIVRKNEAAGLLPPIVQTEDGLRVTHYVDVAAQVDAMGAEERAIPVLEHVLKNIRLRMVRCRRC